MKKLVIIACLSLVIGCSVNSSKLSERYAQDFVDDMRFVKSRSTGLCFGVIASRKTGDLQSTGVGITQVPCIDVGL